MSNYKKKEAPFFKWIRAARAEINRETEGMTAEEYVAYIHAKAEQSRLERAVYKTKRASAKPKTKVRKAGVGGN